MQVQSCPANAAPATAAPGDDPAAAPVFDVVITPQRSLGMLGVLVLMAICGALAIAPAYWLARAGLWANGAFVLVDGMVLFVAVVACRRDLRRAERVLVADGVIRVERFDGHRRFTRYGCFPLFGLTVEQRLDPDYGCVGLYLRHRTEQVEIARDLPPGERIRFRAALIEALESIGCRPQRRTTAAGDPSRVCAGDRL